MRPCRLSHKKAIIALAGILTALVLPHRGAQADPSKYPGVRPAVTLPAMSLWS